jgi:hypothetical protein
MRNARLRKLALLYKPKGYQHKGKVKQSLSFNCVPHHEGVLGSGGVATHILDLGTRWRWQFLASATSRPGKQPLVPIG